MRTVTRELSRMCGSLHRRATYERWVRAQTEIGVGDMNVKPLWETRTFYVALAAIVTAVGAYMTDNATVLEMVQMVLAALGGLAIRRGLPK